MIRIMNESDSEFKCILVKDPQLKKKDSVIGVKEILEKLKMGLAGLNKTSFKEKMKNYYLCYNGTIYIYQICRHLRESEYGQECIPYIGFSITSIESYLILNEPKYLEWRVKLYIWLAQLYEEQNTTAGNQSALKVIENIRDKINQQKDDMEKTTKLLDYVVKGFEQNLFRLKVLEMKYRMLDNQLSNADLIKKKLDELFGQNIQQKFVALIECIKGRTKSQNRDIGL